MQHPKITLDVARSMLLCGDREVRIESRLGAIFLAALWSASTQQAALTSDAWHTHLQEQNLATPDRTGMRRLLQHLEQRFDHLEWTGPRPVVLSPARGTTVGPWRLHGEACRSLSVRHAVDADSARRFACLVLNPATGDSTEEKKSTHSGVTLKLLDCFLIGDDLARNGMFADAAASMAKALTLRGLSVEMQCALHFRKVKYLRRAGQFARAKANLAQVALLLADLGWPMRGHVQAELAVQGWRLQYDDVAHADKYDDFRPPSANGFLDFHTPTIDARLLWQQFNLWASEWRRQMETEDLSAVQTAFNNAKKGYEAAIYWALVSEDALNVMNIAANMGYLLHLSSQKKLADHSVEALDWLLLSQAYVERFEWPEESLWDYVYLAELYLTSKTVRKHLQMQGWRLTHALTPDGDEFYVHALGLGVRLGEPRQLANMYQLYMQYLQSTGQSRKAKTQAKLLDALLDQHPGLREKLMPEGGQIAM
jgi:hypothetical protein